MSLGILCKHYAAPLYYVTHRLPSRALLFVWTFTFLLLPLDKPYYYSHTLYCTVSLFIQGFEGTCDYKQIRGLVERYKIL